MISKKLALLFFSVCLALLGGNSNGEAIIINPDSATFADDMGIELFTPITPTLSFQLYDPLPSLIFIPPGKFFCYHLLGSTNRIAFDKAFMLSDATTP